MKYIFLLAFAICSKIYSQEVVIGKQTWSTQNLDVVKFRNGDPIPEAKTQKEWIAAQTNKKPAWCYYNNDTLNGKKYGKLYNWFAIKDPRGLAPEGWHLPEAFEWYELLHYVKNNYTYDGDPGTKLKDSTDWVPYTYAGAGNNATGFKGLPGGQRDTKGKFISLGAFGVWWTATTNTNGLGLSYMLYNQSTNCIEFADIEQSGCSVRCVKD